MSGYDFILFVYKRALNTRLCTFALDYRFLIHCFLYQAMAIYKTIGDDQQATNSNVGKMDDPNADRH